MNITKLWDDGVFTGNKLPVNSTSYSKRLYCQWHTLVFGTIATQIGKNV